MSSVMIYWLDKNGWSHPDFEALAAWALSEQGALHGSQVSHIRNGKMRMMGVKSLDAFGAINQAVWAYNNDRDAFRQMGCDTVTEKIERTIKGKMAIIDPETKQPLDQGGWMNLYLGYLKIEEVSGLANNDEKITEKLAADVQIWIAKEIHKSGTPIHQVTPMVRKLLKNDEKTGKIMQAITALAPLNAVELPDLLDDLTKVVNEVTGSDRTPQQVLQEAST